MLQYFVVVVRI